MFFFFKQKTAYEIRLSIVGSEMCIRGSLAALCGSTVVDPIQGTNLQQFQPEWFGTLRKATITKYDTKAIAYTEDAGGNCWIEERIQEPVCHTHLTLPTRPSL